jgi:hypothetical protein
MQIGTVSVSVILTLRSENGYYIILSARSTSTTVDAITTNAVESQEMIVFC